MYGAIDRFLVPLDAPLARRYFNESLYVPQGLRGRLFGPRLHRAEATGIDRLVELMEEVPPQVIPRDGGAIYLREYAHLDDRGRTLGFFFRRGEATPSVVVKAQAEGLRREAQALEQMRAFLPPILKSTLPEVMLFHDSPRGELLVTSALPGRSGYVEMQGSFAPRKYVEGHFDAAAQWLAAFHDATRVSASSEIDGVAVPHSASHGDFWVRNVLIDEKGAIGVVDWEHFTPAASPFQDLFHYAHTYGLNYPWRRYRRAAPEEAFQKTFVESNRVSRAVRRYLEQYMERVGLPKGLIEPALAMWSAAAKAAASPPHSTPTA